MKDLKRKIRTIPIWFIIKLILEYGSDIGWMFSKQVNKFNLLSRFLIISHFCW